MKEVFHQLYAHRVLRIVGPERAGELTAMMDTLAEEYDPTYNSEWERQRMKEFAEGITITAIRPKP